jgi:ABC-type branched-subunit amino acid transport system ATPase component
MTSAPLLEARALGRNFGALVAARAIDFRLDAGARHALIGPNGAGKTTFVNLLAGTLLPTEGRVFLKGSDITTVSETERVKRGIARTFQINRLFRGLTVLENVFIAVAERTGVAPALFRPVGRCTHVVDEAMHLLETLKLQDEAGQRVRELPYGRQRLVEIAIALGLKPEVLLLDEPAAGVPSTESHLILDTVAGLPRHVGVLIIEHDMDVVFRFAERVTVLVAGSVLTEGTPREIMANEQVRAVYLGQENPHEARRD